jgi:hypothetical protein
MEYSDENFRFYILAEVKRGVKAKTIYEHLRQAFDDAAPSQAFVYKWHKNFSTGLQVKKGLRQREIISAQDVFDATLQLFREIPPQRFISELHKVKEHCEKVIACGGDYVIKP